MLRNLCSAVGNISIAVLLLSLANVVNGQTISPMIGQQPTAEFHFTRLVYDNAPGSRRALRGWGDAWSTDYPDAEYHLMPSINRLTRVDGQLVDYSGNGGRLIALNDDTLFDYPWLYAVEVGQWRLGPSETAMLREYLNRGGFLLVDDFWGEEEWSVFIESMRRVFPDRAIVEVPDDHEIMHVHFDIVERLQIPGRNGSRPGTRPHWRAIFDDDGRAVVAINFNMDMGDAWEHADDPTYPAAMTGLAYRFAVNYVIYALTH